LREAKLLAKDYDRLNGLIQTIYSAATDEVTWQVVLDNIQASLGHAYLALHGQDTSTHRNIGMIGAGYSVPYLASFRQHFAAINPWSERAATMPVGVALPSEALLQPEALYRTEWYNDWIRPQEDISTGAGLTLMRDSHRIFRISCNIRLVDRERLQPRVIGMLNALSPHLRHGFAIYHHARRETDRGAEKLEIFSGAAFIVGADRRIQQSNARARKLVSDVDPMLDCQDGRLGFAESRAHNWLERVLAQFSVRHLSAAGRSFTLRRPDGDMPQYFRVLPLPRALSGNGGEDFLSPAADAALVLVSLPEKNIAGPALSRREADALGHLAQGMANDRIAFALGIKPETVNLHIMSARRRLGARTREQAIAIAVRLGLI
jgi:DNA-binding CsgD family transcriptional regulator